MTIQQQITDKLQRALRLEHLDVINESDKHNVPKGSESHFKLVIVSADFEGKSLLARHRLINDLLKDELALHIHALSLHTLTKQAWSAKGQVPESPSCLGGDATRG